MKWIERQNFLMAICSWLSIMVCIAFILIIHSIFVKEKVWQFDEGATEVKTYGNREEVCQQAINYAYNFENQSKYEGKGVNFLFKHGIIFAIPIAHLTISPSKSVKVPIWNCGKCTGDHNVSFHACLDAKKCYSIYKNHKAAAIWWRLHGRGHVASYKWSLTISWFSSCQVVAWIGRTRHRRTRPWY